MSAPAKKIRLDELLVARGLVASRAQAKALVMAGRVRSGTERLDKPGRDFPADCELTVEQPPRFVSRGGEKLSAALTAFALDLTGAHVLDVGASTGGFTDCALQAGAADVICVDVGRAQLHAKLLADLWCAAFVIKKTYPASDEAESPISNPSSQIAQPIEGHLLHTQDELFGQPSPAPAPTKKAKPPITKNQEQGPAS